VHFCSFLKIAIFRCNCFTHLALCSFAQQVPKTKCPFCIPACRDLIGGWNPGFEFPDTRRVGYHFLLGAEMTNKKFYFLQSKLRADALCLLAAFIWGTAFVAQRSAMLHIGPISFNAARFALGALVLLPIVLHTRLGVAGRSRGGRHSEDCGYSGGLLIKGGCLAGLILFAGSVLQQAGLVYTTAGKAGFITGLYVVIVPLLGAFFGRPVGWTVWLAIVLVVVGTYLLSVTGRFIINVGDLFVLAAAWFWALHVLVIGWLAPKLPRHAWVRLACLQFGLCSLLSFVVAIFAEGTTLTGLMAASGSIVYVGVLSVGIGFSLQIIAQKLAPPAHAAILFSLEAVFAVLAGWVILGEVLAPRAIFGCALILCGMIAAQIRLWGAAAATPSPPLQSSDRIK
jgi:drug/metabolite transporter (DMT)-like permease